MNLLQFISAFGLGAVVTTIMQAYLAQKADKIKRTFEEKKESYLGFLDAMYKSEVEKTHETSLAVGHWQNRIELVGSTHVIRACQRFAETNPTQDGVHPERPQVLRDLKKAMREDLGVA